MGGRELNLEVGYHKFLCPILAVCAQHGVRDELNLPAVSDEYEKEMHERNILTGAHFGRRNGDGTRFGGHFPMWSFEEWEQWTEHKHGAKVVECMGAHHSDVKVHPHTEHIWKALQGIIVRW